MSADEPPALTWDDGLALLARLIADDMRRGGPSGAPPAVAPTAGRRGPYKPRHPITVRCVPQGARASAS